MKYKPLIYWPSQAHKPFPLRTNEYICTHSRHKDTNTHTNTWARSPLHKRQCCLWKIILLLQQQQKIGNRFFFFFLLLICDLFTFTHINFQVAIKKNWYYTVRPCSWSARRWNLDVFSFFMGSFPCMRRTIRYCRYLHYAFDMAASPVQLISIKRLLFYRLIRCAIYRAVASLLSAPFVCFLFATNF